MIFAGTVVFSFECINFVIPMPLSAWVVGLWASNKESFVKRKGETSGEPLLLASPPFSAKHASLCAEPDPLRNERGCEIRAAL